MSETIEMGGMTETQGGGTPTGDTRTGSEAKGGGSLELIRGSVDDGSEQLPGDAVTQFAGVDLPEGARVEQGADGKPTIHLPPHSAMPRTSDKVAIIGFTPSKANAPWTDPAYEFWGLNALYVHAQELPMQRFTRWFDVHGMEAVSAERLEAYRRLRMPVYLQETVADMPHSVRFPAERLRERFGSYFTNSISWMIALALDMGFKVIEVYGVDMAQDTEYRHQRPNVEYFLGIAKGMGVEIKVAPTSDLLRATHEYGYGTDHGLRAKLKERLEEFNNREAGLVEEIRRLELARATVNGAKQNVEWMLQSWAVADHTSMTPDVAAVAPGAAVGGGA